MAERKPWSCKACGAVLGWQDADGLEVVPESIERFTLPALAEEIWVTCKQCGAVQVWRARVEAPKAPGRWRARENPADRTDEPPSGFPPGSPRR